MGRPGAELELGTPFAGLGLVLGREQLPVAVAEELSRAGGGADPVGVVGPYGHAQFDAGAVVEGDGLAGDVHHDVRVAVAAGRVGGAGRTPYRVRVGPGARRAVDERLGELVGVRAAVAELVPRNVALPVRGGGGELGNRLGIVLEVIEELDDAAGRGDRLSGFGSVHG